MVTILHPLESGAALGHAPHMPHSPRSSPGMANVGIGMGINVIPNLPGLIASPFGIGLSPNAYMPRMLDPMVHAHTSLLLAAAYGQDSVPQVIATEPSNSDLASIQYPHERENSIGLKSPGVKLDEFDDMKRALDLSSLPLNPVTGAAPTLEQSPKTSTQTSLRATPNMTDTATLQGKKARLSPIASPRQPPFTPGSTGHGQPSLPGPIQTANGNGASMTSPMHFGGPLTPNAPARQGTGTMGNLTVPSTPIMGMMPGVMSYGMNTFGQMNANYPTSPILSPSMNPNIMTGNYGPAAAAAAAAAAGNLTGRTVYVGNLPAEASVDELLNLVRFGPIESVRLLPERSCVFISFLDGSTAAGFHADAQVKKLALHGQELKIGWGKASHLSGAIQNEVQNSQATRNVFVGSLDEATTEQDLRDALSSFGPIDQVKIVRDKNIGFVHFLSIATAMQVVAVLPTLQGWENKRVSYGKDRCAYVPKAQQAAVQLAQQQALAAVQAQHGQPPSSPFAAFSPMTPNFSQFSTPNTPNFASPVFPSNGFAGVNMNGSGAFGGHSGATTPNGALGAAMVYGSDAAGQMGNRTVYLGNLMPGTTTEELCNNIRGGQLQQIKHLTDKNIAFVTFVDPNCALNFYNQASTNQLTLNTRRLKIGWGKHSGPLNSALVQAVKSGASRNVYLGQIQDFDKFTADKLKQDFGQYGDIEMVNFYQEKNAAFVNYTSIQSAQAAIEGIKTLPEYSDLRVSFGKDRCANAPRPLDRSRPTPARNGSQLSTNGNLSTPKKPTNNEDEIPIAPTPEASTPVMAEQAA